ncbi:MAG: hypothetical protein K0S46_2721 [Moraxellaceae bacterium]|jgi:hypothetical protein|nr:hypothetical protein [Moraxellaceae bacterium]
MSMEQCVPRARLVAGGPSVRRNVTRGQRDAPRALQCRALIGPRAGPLCQKNSREPPPSLIRTPRRPLRAALAFLAAIALPSPGYPAPAPTDGRIGATSTGSTTITLIIPNRIRVTGINDITLGTYSGASLTGSSPACVSQNGPGTYSVTLTSANGRFALASTTQAATVPYAVAWAATSLRYNTASGAFATDTPSLAACTPVANRLTVTVPREAMDDAPPGAYADTLTVMVAPL